MTVPHSFWQDLRAHGAAPALRTGGRTINYADLADAAEALADRLPAGEKKLALLASGWTQDFVSCYLALLSAGYAVMICPTVDGALAARYRPDIIIANSPDLPDQLAANVRRGPGPEIPGYSSHMCPNEQPAPHPELGLLLSTSGSTGSIKLARLSARNISIAAGQMRQTLALSPAERAITSLPAHHVYGLSVLHSQLSAGGTLVLNNISLMSRRFWRRMQDERVTILGGVPWMYEMMRTAGITPHDLPDLRKLHQSGAKMPPELAGWLCRTFANRGAELFFMYGQTEASGRMCVLPPALACSGAGSVGRPVPGGGVSISAEGEVIYSGPNVMMGYAHDRSDLARGDELCGVLHTGDLGNLGQDGLLYLTGRRNRICKILGERINLDEVENWLTGMAVIGSEDGLIVCCEQPSGGDIKMRKDVAARLHIPDWSVSVRHVRMIPRTAAGKIAHAELGKIMGETQ